ncbi:MAG TPA: RND family transporter, partial [Pseudomonadales bacterium]|nr:RND family transporter [Pseudomonadales bacterium]
MTMLAHLYRRFVLKGAAWLMIALLAMSVFFALQVPNIKLDASSDSLVLEGDNALEVYRQTTKTFGSDEFLLVTFKPRGELLADENLATIARLRDELAALEQVTSVVSILDVPLLQSPPLSLTDLSSDIHTLSDPSVDKQLAAEELRTSPIYKDLLSNAEGDITMLQVNLFNDPRYNDLLNARDDLRA